MNMAEVISLGAAQAARAKTLPCPFCGSDPYPPANVNGRFVVECENGDCHASASTGGDSPADAIAKWNRRA